MANVYGLAMDIKGMVEARTGKEVHINKVKKNNGQELTGIVIRGESNVSPTVYVESLMEKYREDIEAMVEEVIEVSEENAVPNLNVDNLLNIDVARENIFCVLVNTKSNQHRFEEVVNTPYLDLSLIYKIRVNGEMAPTDGMATVTVNNAVLKHLNITKEELHEIAKENTPKMFPYHYEDMREVIAQMMGCDIIDVPVMPGAPMMNILSNTEKLNGATCIFYPNCLKEISKGKKLIVIPSSVHETIIMDYESYADEIESVTQMIQEVNVEAVSVEDRLADHLYIYDPETDELYYDDEYDKQDLTC